MKACPLCKNSYEDWVEFCFQDGMPLVVEAAPKAAQAPKAAPAAPVPPPAVQAPPPPAAPPGALGGYDSQWDAFDAQHQQHQSGRGQQP